MYFLMLALASGALCPFSSSMDGGLTAIGAGTCLDLVWVAVEVTVLACVAMVECKDGLRNVIGWLEFNLFVPVVILPIWLLR